MANLKKISIVVCTYPPYRGGMGNAAKRQAELLHKAGYEVEVITPGVSDGEEVQDGIKVRRVKPILRYGNASVLSNINELCANSDIIFLHYPFFGTAEFLRLRGQSPLSKVRGRTSYLREQKLVVYYHMDAMGKGWLGAIFNIHKKFLLPAIMKRADKILVSSDSYFNTSFIKNITGKVEVVPFSVDVPKNEITDNFGNKALFVGGLDSAHYFKGLNNLLLAWKKVVNHLPDTKLDIVGDGNLRKEYEKKAQDLGLGDKVIFHGGVPVLDKMYAEARVTILPSVDRSEAFGLVLLESMAMGTPVIASDLPGVNSVVQKEVGELVAPNNVDDLANKIIEVMGEKLDVEDREKIRDYVLENYSDEKIQAKLTFIIESL